MKEYTNVTAANIAKGLLLPDGFPRHCVRTVCGDAKSVRDNFRTQKRGTHVSRLFR
jgi:hypothetical protein